MGKIVINSKDLNKEIKRIESAAEKLRYEDIGSDRTISRLAGRMDTIKLIKKLSKHAKG